MAGEVVVQARREKYDESVKDDCGKGRIERAPGSESAGHVQIMSQSPR